MATTKKSSPSKGGAPFDVSPFGAGCMGVLVLIGVVTFLVAKFVI